MKASELIKILQEHTKSGEDPEVVIYDWSLCVEQLVESGNAVGVYKDFRVDLRNVGNLRSHITLTFDSHDFDDNGRVKW